MAQSTKCLILLAVIALFFITEIIPLAVTAMAGSIACGLLGFIPAKQVFSGLSNSTVVLFAGMFVVGAAMFYTGLAQKIGETVVRFTGTGENSLMVGVMLVGAGLSSVLSNTGTAACLLPVVLGVCAAAKIPASTELMPLAFACGLGGIITLVGTPPNIIASGALEQAGYRAFGFFEFAKIGIPLTLAGLVYMMFIGKHLLPKRELDADQEIEQEVEATSTSSSKMAVSGIILPAGCSSGYGAGHQGYHPGNGRYHRRYRCCSDRLLNGKTGLCLHRLGNHFPVRRYDACIFCYEQNRRRQSYC